MSLIVSPIVEPLGSLTRAVSEAGVMGYDFSFNGIPFMAHFTDQTPFIDQTAAYQKNQVDQSQEPGEHTLEAWWMRSQLTFHGGAGQKYLEFVNEEWSGSYAGANMAHTRFDQSRNVDVWTPGEASLLQHMVQDTWTDFTNELDDQGILLLDNSASTPSRVSWGKQIARVGNTTTEMYSTAHNGGSGAGFRAACTDGRTFIAADDNTIKPFDPNAGGTALDATQPQWTLPDNSTPVTLGWVKQRLMAGVGQSVYELVNGTAGSANPLPTAKFTHPSPYWQWTAFADSPSAILASGFSGSQSAIYAFELDSSGGAPTLTTGVLAAQLPLGERVLSLCSYSGSLIAIGTDKGVRIGDFSSGGLVYGPLTVTVDGGVHAMMAFDRFVFFGMAQDDGTAGLGRIDLGMATDTAGRYAWAQDVRAEGVTGTVTGVVPPDNEGPAFTVSGTGKFKADGSLARSGWIRTSRIRYSTLEPKLYKYGDVRSEPLVGSILVYSTGDDGVEELDANYTAAGLTVLPSFAMSDKPFEYVAVRIELQPSADFSASPVVRGYQLKALPAAPSQREIQIPLSCFDKETDRNGFSVNRPGWAKSRFQQIKDLEQKRDIVLMQQFYADGTSDSFPVQIDQTQFVQMSNPNRENTLGGILTVTCRTVT